MEPSDLEMSTVPATAAEQQIRLYKTMTCAVTGGSNMDFYKPPRVVFEPQPQGVLDVAAGSCGTAKREMVTYMRKYAADPAVALRMAVVARLTKLGAIQVRPLTSPPVSLYTVETAG